MRFKITNSVTESKVSSDSPGGTKGTADLTPKLVSLASRVQP